MHPPVTPTAAPTPTAYQPQFGRTVAAVGVPTSALTVAGVATALALSYDVVANPALAAIGIVLSGTACGIVVLCYLWLDRWEPEPTRYLLFAWLWGGVAAVFALLTSLFDSDLFISTVIRAPIVEELAKGVFLIIMATGVRRRELNTLIDCLVYAGLVGASFGFIENVLYLARGADIYDTLGVAILRLTMPFAHSFFTSMTAIGLYIGLRRPGKYAWLGFMGLGYVAAVLLHMLWNITGFADHFLFFVPLFGGAVALALVARHREQNILLIELPGLQALGIVTPIEGSWLSTLGGRRRWADYAEKQWGKEAKQVVHTFTGAITELAFVRERFAHGGGSRAAIERHAELVSVVQGLVRPPVPDGPAPVHPDIAARQVAFPATPFAAPFPATPFPATPFPAPFPATFGGPSSPGDAFWNPIPGPP